MARRRYRQAGLGGGALLVQASPLVSGTAPRAQVEAFKPQVQAQPRLDWGEELPPVVIPKPPVRLAKPAPKEQLNMFEE